MQLSSPNKLQGKCRFLLFNRAYSITTNKDDLTKENPRVKQMLKENEYQESTISKIFLKNYEQSQLASVKRQTDVQEQEIRMSIRLQYVEGTSEKLRYILKSHKIRSTFYTGSTLRKLLRKLKNRVATEEKNDIV